MTQASATLEVLYEVWPAGPGGMFVQVRRWSTGDGVHVDTILEYGMVDEGDELETLVTVLPYYLELGEVLALLPLTLPALFLGDVRPVAMVSAD